MGQHPSPYPNADDRPEAQPPEPSSHTPQNSAFASTGSMQSLLSEYLMFEQQAQNQTDTKTTMPSMSIRPLDESLSNAPIVEALPIPNQRAKSIHRPSLNLVPPPSDTPHDDQIKTLEAQIERLKTDLARQVAMTKAAEDMADEDVLTPVLNRRAFLREMQRAMADCKRYGEEACLIFMDLDGFKHINDTYGHAAGDAALVYVAELLKSNIREGDTVGRLGGDEFALLLRHAELPGSKIKAMMLEAELSVGTFAFEGLYLKIGGSFGVRAFAEQTSVEQWLNEADAAMFLVKKSSR